ncbi:hypothetical protein K431DRAFT_296362 [Polychaeton citri CBS 116435]|uniref:Uncharacterized protein n=1 Tax=Polychaeton citri CBS 116435 TaxID=1314669 RepID=A0A9P4Q6S9_9PEZI|nr:hypothetical protein K431DRAFT_296362 [Polychaeton citri CBS 116435]
MDMDTELLPTSNTHEAGLLDEHPASPLQDRCPSFGDEPVQQHPQIRGSLSVASCGCESSATAQLQLQAEMFDTNQIDWSDLEKIDMDWLQVNIEELETDLDFPIEERHTQNTSVDPSEPLQSLSEIFTPMEIASTVYLSTPNEINQETLTEARQGNSDGDTTIRKVSSRASKFDAQKPPVDALPGVIQDSYSIPRLDQYINTYHPNDTELSVEETLFSALTEYLNEETGAKARSGCKAHATGGGVDDTKDSEVFQTSDLQTPAATLSPDIGTSTSVSEPLRTPHATPQELEDAFWECHITLVNMTMGRQISGTMHRLAQVCPETAEVIAFLHRSDWTKTKGLEYSNDRSIVFRYRKTHPSSHQEQAENITLGNQPWTGIPAFSRASFVASRRDVTRRGFTPGDIQSGTQDRGVAMPYPSSGINRKRSHDDVDDLDPSKKTCSTSVVSGATQVPLFATKPQDPSSEISNPARAALTTGLLTISSHSSPHIIPQHQSKGKILPPSQVLPSILDHIQSLTHFQKFEQDHPLAYEPRGARFRCELLNHVGILSGNNDGRLCTKCWRRLRRNAMNNDREARAAMAR